MARHVTDDRERRPPVGLFVSIFSVRGDHWQVLAASVHDVRYLAALLRGVNFVNVRGADSTHRPGLTPPRPCILACDVGHHEQRIHCDRRGSAYLARSATLPVTSHRLTLYLPSNRIHLQGRIRRVRVQPRKPCRTHVVDDGFRKLPR